MEVRDAQTHHVSSLGFLGRRAFTQLIYKFFNSLPNAQYNRAKPVVPPSALYLEVIGVGLHAADLALTSRCWFPQI
jgi:hypothetical protein